MHSCFCPLSRLLVAGFSATLLSLALAENNTLTLIDGVVSNRNAALIIGNNGTNNTLVVTNGGQLTTWDGTIGQTPGGRFNYGFIVGPGSSWTVNGLLSVGDEGRVNHLSVLDGARLFSSNAVIGSQPTGNSNQMLLQGPGSTWTNSGVAVVGQGASFNRVLIEEQATWTTDSLQIGHGVTNINGSSTRATNNVVEVNGADTRLYVSHDLVVGRFGTGNQLRILSGGEVFSGAGIIGRTASNSTVEISGPGSRWVVTNTLLMGISGASNGFLMISNGASLTSGSADIGQRTNAGSQRIVVTGAGSQFSVASNLWLGSTSSWNRLEIRDGGFLSSGAATIGREAFVDSSGFPSAVVGGSNNVAIVEGLGSLWTNSDTLTIGYRGSRNELIISNGGTVYSGELSLGQSLVSSGFISPTPTSDANRVRVEGADSQLLVSGLTEVGGRGRSNQLEIFRGALATSDSAVVGASNTLNNNNLVIVGDAGSLWEVTNQLTVGRAGTGNRLVVTNGGTVRSGSAVIGDLTPSSSPPSFSNASYLNEVMVTGLGSVWSNAGLTWISATSSVSSVLSTSGVTNRLTIANGGTVFTDGLSASAPRNQRGLAIITVDQGNLFVTNAAGTALLELNRAHLIVSNGVAVADRLLNNHRADTLRVSDTLFVGRTGGVTSGQMRIGGGNSEWTNLGSAFLGGLVLGSEVSTTGRVTLGRSTLGSAGTGISFSTTTNAITNALGTAALVVGDMGSGILNVSTGAVIADVLLIGNQSSGTGYVESAGAGSASGVFINALVSAGSNDVTHGAGLLVITNSGTLRANQILGASASNSIFNYGGVFQFTTNAPLISGGVWGTNVRISYLGITNAPLLRPQLPGVTNIALSGAIELELSRATNSEVAPLRLAANDSSTFASIRLVSDSRLQTLGLLVESNAFITFASGPQTIAGPVTNRGVLTGAVSIAQFEGPVVFEPGANLVGNNPEFRFGSGLIVRSNEFLVPEGVAVEPSSVAAESGSLLVAGTFQVTNLAPAFPAGVIRLTNGTLSYRNLTNVGLAREGGLLNLQFDGSTTLRLNHSTNAWLDHYTFTSANNVTGYAGLRLEGGSPLWQSGSLTIGSGGTFVITNATAAVQIASQQLLVTNGGKVVISSASSAAVGFSADASSHRWTITGAGSELRPTTTFVVGGNGTSNQLVISDGAAVVYGQNFLIGDSATALGNVVEVTGAGSGLLHQGNGSLTVGEEGASSRLVVRDGGLVSARDVNLANVGTAGNSMIEITGNGSRLLAGDLSVAVRFLPTNAGSNTVWVTSGAELTITNSTDVSGTAGGNRLLVNGGGRWTNGGNFDMSLTSGTNANWLIISNAGSELVVGGKLRLGGNGGDNLHVLAGGRLQTYEADIGGLSSNLAVVADSGSTWTNQGALWISSLITGQSNRVEILRGGRVFTDQLYMSAGSDSNRANSLRLQRGYLTVTNVSMTSELAATNRPGADIWIDQSDLTLDALVLTNETNKLLTFLGGTFRTRRTDFDQPRVLIVGDGTQSARFEFTGNGSHRFAGGLGISPNAELNGAGTVIGSVTNSGRLSPGTPIGGLTIDGELTLLPAAGLHFDVGGLMAGTGFDQLNVNSLVEFAGTLSLSLRNGFVPGAGDVFALMNFSLRTGTFANAPDGSRVKTADSLGSFLVSYGPSTLTISSYQTTDTDGDQIDDSWALLNFGITPLGPGTGPTDQSGDADGDGQSNHAEFLAGTDPNLATDVFAVLSVTPTPEGHMRLRFRELSGKQYRILFSDNLVTWAEVAEPWLTFVGGGEVEWLDDGAQTGVLPATRSYKVSLR